MAISNPLLSVRRELTVVVVLPDVEVPSSVSTTVCRDTWGCELLLVVVVVVVVVVRPPGSRTVRDPVNVELAVALAAPPAYRR